MHQNKLSRRKFIGTVAVAIPVTAITVRQAHAQDLPPVAADDPTAKALLYVHDAANVDSSNPLAARYEAGQTCANCVQIQGEDGPEWRGCNLFPGKSVNAAGWCSAWAPKP